MMPVRSATATIPARSPVPSLRAIRARWLLTVSAESPIETPVATREVGRSRVVVQVAEIRDGVLPSVVGNHGPRGVELVGQVVQPDEKARPDRGFYVFETVSKNQDGETVCTGTWTNIVRGV